MHPGPEIKRASARHRRADGEKVGSEETAVPTATVMMNLSKTVDAIVELRSQGASSDHLVAEHLKSILGTADIQVQAQAVSTHSRALLLATVLALTIVFLVGVLRRRHRMAFVSALSIPVILLLELSAGLHVLTWTVHGRSENISAHFPVQHPARTVLVGTYYVEPGKTESNRFAETISAFLLPVTLVIAVLGLWRVAIYIGKFDFEDAHTIAVAMGSVCAVYYALAFGACIQQGLPAKSADASNAGSLAVLVALAEDLSQKYPRLENTSVTVAFFGHGRMGEGGAKEFAREKDGALPAYFIGCEMMGRGGAHGYVLDGGMFSEPLQSDRDLIRAVSRAALKTTGRPLEIVRGETTSATGFVERGRRAIVLTTLPPAPEQGRDGGAGREEIDRGQLLTTLQLLEASLSELDKPQTAQP